MMLSFNIPYELEIVGSSQQLEKQVAQIMRPVLNNAFHIAAPRIEVKLREIVKHAITSCPEYESLLSGQLKAELGVIDARSSLERVLQIWIDSIVAVPNSVRLINGGQTLDGGISIRGIASSMNDVLALDSVEYVSDNGYKVPWLKWLLLYGDEILLTDHHVNFNLNKYEFAYSRTGLAIMRKGGTYRVPPQYSGVKEDNFVTRSLIGIEEQISDLIITEIENVIN